MAQAAGRAMVAGGYGRTINLASQAAVIGLDQRHRRLPDGGFTTV